MAKIPYGWLECNGQTVSRSMYSELFTKFSTQLYDDPSSTQDPTHTLLSRYGEGDGSTTFNLPDYRECALVGIGSNGTFITNNTNQAHEVHTLGEFKDDQFQGHHHEFCPELKNGRTDLSKARHFYVDSGVNDNFYCDTLSEQMTVIGQACSDGTHGTPHIGNTTHGKQIGVTYLIKAL